jgi:hypothetical protein
MAGAADKRKTYLQYALGIITESGWIIAMTIFAFLMAVVAKAIWP